MLWKMNGTGKAVKLRLEINAAVAVDLSISLELTALGRHRAKPANSANESLDDC